MPLAFYFPLSRRQQNVHLRFGGLFVSYPKSQIILLIILLLFAENPPNFIS